MSPAEMAARRRVGGRLVRLAIAIVAVFFCITGGISLHNKSELIERMFESTGRSISEAAALLILEPFTREDYSELEAHARRLVNRENHVSFVVITRERDQRVLVEYPTGARAALAGDSDLRVFEAPVQLRDEASGDRYALGRLAVGMSARPFTQLLVSEAWSVLLQMLACFVVLGFFLTMALRRWVARPLRVLDAHAAQVARGDLETPLVLEQDDEFGRLAETLERMRKNLLATYQEIRERNERLTELDRLKSEFLANMSHEIRTPLHGLIGMASVLRETAQNEEQEECVEVIVGSAQHLVRVVTDILDFSKIEAGQVELDGVEFSPAEQLEEIADLLGPTALAKGVELLPEIAPEVPAVVRGDATRLRQVLTNVLSNAVKFTEQGEVRVLLEVAGGGGSPELRYRVEDTGVGIEPAVLPTLFDPFTQADTSTSRRFGGTGLGLAISRRLVELMDGSIELDSEVGRGTTCTFSVRVETVRAAAPLPDAGEARGAVVLAVEPHPGHRRHLQTRLEQAGLRCTAVADRTEAAALLVGAGGDDGPQLVLVAVRDRGDLEDRALGALLAGAAQGGLPVLAMLPVHDLHLRRELRQRGATAVLVKPLRRQTLLRQVCSHLGPVRPGAAAGQVPDQEAPAGRRILVVDDNEINRRVACSMLQKLGHCCETAGDGREALDRLARDRFDLVLLDVQMPEVDGYEVARTFRQREGEDGHLPIVAMTAHATPEDRARCLASGMDDFISKPVDLARLRGLLERWLPALDGTR